jgi:hypothetical protein
VSSPCWAHYHPPASKRCAPRCLPVDIDIELLGLAGLLEFLCDSNAPCRSKWNDVVETGALVLQMLGERAIVPGRTAFVLEEQERLLAVIGRQVGAVIAGTKDVR